MYLELIYYEDNQKIVHCDNMRDSQEYKVFQKLKSLVRE